MSRRPSTESSTPPSLIEFAETVVLPKCKVCDLPSDVLTQVNAGCEKIPRQRIVRWLEVLGHSIASGTLAQHIVKGHHQ